MNNKTLDKKTISKIIKANECKIGVYKNDEFVYLAKQDIITKVREIFAKAKNKSLSVRK